MLTAALLLGATVAHAQLRFAEWNTAGTSFVWLTNTNWVGGENPNSPTDVAWFGANSFGLDTIVYPGSSEIERQTSTTTIQMTTAGRLREVAAVVLSPLNTIDRRIRNNGNNSVGEIRVYGGTMAIGEEVYENLLFGNFSQDNQMRIYMNARHQLCDIRFMNSGVIHVHNTNAMTRFTVRWYEAEGVPVSITKTGAGILNMGVDYGADNDPAINPNFQPRLDTDRNEITGDMILKDGFIMSTYSGSSREGGFNSPYGQGNLVLQGGALISTTTVTLEFVYDEFGNPVLDGLGNHMQRIAGSTSGSRSVYNNVIIDGNAGFGTLEDFGTGFMDNDTYVGFTYNGSFTVQNTYGNSTTLASDSSVTCTSLVTWYQDMTGPHTLTKLGDANLRIGGHFDINQLRVETGAAYFFGAEDTTSRQISGAVTAASGARFGGNGTVTGSVTVESGGTLEPAISAVGGQLAVGSLTLNAGASAHFGIAPVPAAIPEAPEQEDLQTTPVVASGAVALGGANLSVTIDGPLTHPLVLINNRSGSPVSGLFSIDGSSLTEGTVISLPTGDVTITYNFSEGDYSQSVALIPPGVGPGTGYDAWREARYGNTSDPAGAPTAQPAGQPVANLLFYALGLDLAPDAATGLPQATTGEPSISFQRRADLEANLTVQGTDGSPAGAWTDLTTLTAGSSSWTGSATVTEEPAGAGLIRVTVTDTAGSATGVRLLRIQSSLP